MENTTLGNWRTEIKTFEVLPTLKINSGETKEFIFKDEGSFAKPNEFGNSIRFKVLHNNSFMHFYVSSRNGSFLDTIKALGIITNMKVKVSRSGIYKATKYTIEKV